MISVFRRLRRIGREDVADSLSESLPNLVVLVHNFMRAGVEQLQVAHVIAAAYKDMSMGSEVTDLMDQVQRCVVVRVLRRVIYNIIRPPAPCMNSQKILMSHCHQLFSSFYDSSFGFLFGSFFCLLRARDYRLVLRHLPQGQLSRHAKNGH